MKKYLLLSVLMVSAIAIHAQINFGIKYGRSLSKQERNDAHDNDLLSWDAFKGTTVGFVADMPLTRHLHVQPQLLYSTRGAKFTSKQSEWTKVSLKYIEMPVNLIFKTNIGIGKLFAGGGPVLGWGIGGRVYRGEHTTRAFGKDHEFRRLDISANAVGGIEFKGGFFLSANYQYGLWDVNRNTDVRNRTFALTVGQILDWRKS